MERWQIRVLGGVQGVGFRPKVYRLASEIGCTGWVANDRVGVTIELQGNNQQLSLFSQSLRNSIPPIGYIREFSRRAVEVVVGETAFRILPSEGVGESVTSPAPDIAPCDECQCELREPLNRRYNYPFINCAHCGPRYTIQTAVPYDRSHTTMSMFEMCSDCLTEYSSPQDRRFHAQPIACPACGPHVWYQKNRHIKPDFNAGTLSVIEEARRDIAAGKIVAIKGVGGFHLACDARNGHAVGELRRRKRRPSKPLAVMVADLQTAELFCELSSADAQQLQSYQRPVVLVRKLSNRLPEVIAPGNLYLGVMLPSSPLHAMLMVRGEVWVMTSGNLSEEPIVFDNDEALQRLAGIADSFLLHNRPIHTICDDSVVRHVQQLGGEKLPIVLRRSRGYTPHVIHLDEDAVRDSEGDFRKHSVLAIGGEFKGAICLANDNQMILGPHLGDMGSVLAVESLDRCCRQFLDIYNVMPKAIACDLHPGYVSVNIAARFAERVGATLIRVQHHHAHAAALIAEHKLPVDEQLLVCVFDGTGYGTDGAIWGGEFLLASGQGYRRVASLCYVPLPGGDRCIRQPAKTGLAYLHAAQEAWQGELACLSSFSGGELRNLRSQLERRFATVNCSSVGRLFDAVAGIVGVRSEIEFEGQAAMDLEYLAEEYFDANQTVVPYEIKIVSSDIPRWDIARLISQVSRDVKIGRGAREIAAKFHQTVAVATKTLCERVWMERTVDSAAAFYKRVGLTGGVFQNALLVRLAGQELQEAGFEVLLPKFVPVNDGGLALGQAYIARALLAGTTSTRD